MKFGIIGNLDKPALPRAVGMLIEQLEASGVSYVIDHRVVAQLLGAGHTVAEAHGCQRERCMSEADILIAFGGDGTILSAARSVGAKGTPILGVNLGKLGFLAEVAPHEIREAIADIIARKYHVEERLVLEATTPSVPGKRFFAVNDIVVDKSRSSRVIDVETHIDRAFAVTYRGDGLIISTPTGSTAYALSNGGPIVTPMSAVIGITPISPHTLSGRPLIVPEGSEIRVIVHADSNEVLLSADGQTEALLRPPIEVTIKRADYRVHLVKRSDKTYFDVLRAKLLWGRNPKS